MRRHKAFRHLVADTDILCPFPFSVPGMDTQYTLIGRYYGILAFPFHKPFHRLPPCVPNGWRQGRSAPDAS